MAVIDMHAHVTPERYKHAIHTVGAWYGLDDKPGELGFGGFDNTVDQRLADMDEQGVDIQVVTPTAGFYQYANDIEVTRRIHRECNDEIGEMVATRPNRFIGLGIVPMQDPDSAIAELERVMGDLGLRGVMISDHVAGRTYDEPQFLPFFRCAEQAGALVFFHQGGDTCVASRINRFKLTNAVGNLTERTLAFGALVFGGVMDACPELLPLLAHGGGYVPYGIARLDKVAGAMEETSDELAPPFGDDGFVQRRPPSDYLRRFYYDCCTYSGPVLRFLIDTVGIDRVVFGTDYPAPMLLRDGVRWIHALPELTDEEKEAILVGTPASVLGLDPPGRP